MQALRKNPETGFLESSNVSFHLKRQAFTSDLKVKFLELAHETIDQQAYPSVDAICTALKINHSTFDDHLKHDEAFRAAWQNVRRRLMHVFTDKLAVKAESKMGTLANLAILRNLETNTWTNTDRVQISTDNDADKRLSGAKTVIIDAELDNSPPNSQSIDAQSVPSASNSELPK